MAIVIVLLNIGGYLLMNIGIRGIVGGGCAHTKSHEWFPLGGSRCLLGAGALGAPAFVSVVAAVASSTSARTSWCLVAAHAMVPDYLDTKLAYLFYVVEPGAAACLGDPTGTPTGSGTLGASEGLGWAVPEPS